MLGVSRHMGRNGGENQLKQLTVVALFVILALNLVATAYVALLSRATASAAFSQAKLNESELAQLEKLYNLATDFRAELENIAGRASFPSQKKKIAATRYLQNQKMTLERVRIEYKKLREAQTQEAGVRFITIAWGDDSFLSGTRLMEVNEWAFADYNNMTENYVPYPNVSFAKLEALNNEFRVIALSLIKDIK